MQHERVDAGLALHQRPCQRERRGLVAFAMFAVGAMEALLAEDHAPRRTLPLQLRPRQVAHQHRQVAERHARGVVAVGGAAIAPEAALEQVLGIRVEGDVPVEVAVLPHARGERVEQGAPRRRLPFVAGGVAHVPVVLERHEDAAVPALAAHAAMHAAHKAKDESAKEAELLSVLKAAADGSLNAVGENTPEDAAKDNANAELDMENRKPEEYLKGPGKTDLPNVGHVGASMDAPKGPEKLNPDTTPARETKSASFNEAVKTAAAQWGGKLPLTMPQTEKRAHILAIAGMPEDMREGYVQHLLGS